MTGIRILFIYVCSFLSGSESQIQIRDGNIFKSLSLERSRDFSENKSRIFYFSEIQNDIFYDYNQLFYYI